MEIDARKFLRRFREDGLEARGVLRPNRHFGYLLNNESVAPLLRLMIERKVSRLVADDRDWYLAIDVEFKNPGSEESKEGNVRDLKNQGSVFNEQNRHINPFFKSANRRGVTS